MGLMVGFMLIVVFLMPKLMENMGMLLKTYLLTFFIFRVSFMHVSLRMYLLCMGEMFDFLLEKFGTNPISAAITVAWQRQSIKIKLKYLKLLLSFSLSSFLKKNFLP